MMTLKELRSQIKVKAEESKRVPTWKQLMESGEKVIAEHVMMEAKITVYANGYVVYQTSDRVTVFPIPDSTDVIYGSVMQEEDTNEKEKIPAEIFEEAPWYLRLWMEGDERLTSNSDRYYRTHAFSFTDIGEDWEELVDSVDPVEESLIDQEPPEQLEYATEKQREVMISFFVEGDSYIEISLKTGKSRQSVRKLIENGVHRLRVKLCVEDPPTTCQEVLPKKRRKK